MTNSLESRLLKYLGTSFVLVLTLSGLILHKLATKTLERDFDKSLLLDAHTLAALVDNEGAAVQSEMSQRQMPRFDRLDRPDVYKIWRSDGSEFEQSRFAHANDLPFVQVSSEQGPLIQNESLADGRPARVVRMVFIPHYDPQTEEDDQEGVPIAGDAAKDVEKTETDEREEAEIAAARQGTAVAVERGQESNRATSMMQGSQTSFILAMARDTVDLHRVLASFRWVLLIVLGVAVVSSLVVAIPLIRAGLKPLQRTSQEIQSINPVESGVRLDSTAAPEEVKSVIDCLNDLLHRMEQSLERERTLSSNVAHELRTPLGGLRTLMEVALSRPRDAAEYQQTISRCLCISKETQQVVESLLALARLDAGNCQVHCREVNLTSLLTAAWRPFVDKAEVRQLAISWEIEGEPVLCTDPDLVAIILQNVFDNCVSYTDQGGSVTLSVIEEPSALLLRFANSGCTLTADQVPLVFDRFWRGSKSRSDVGQHAGLGLATCREIAKLLRTPLRAYSTGGDFVIELCFPFTNAPPASVTGAGEQTRGDPVEGRENADTLSSATLDRVAAAEASRLT